MAVKRVPTTYQASDGTKFDTQKEAERYDAMITAKGEYETARRRFGYLLAQTQKTADGEVFEITGYGPYYYITPGYFSMPELREVRFRGYDFDFDDSAEFVIRQREGHDYKSEWTVEYKISELYADKRKAEEVLIVAKEARLAELAAEVAELKTKLEPRS